MHLAFQNRGALFIFEVCENLHKNAFKSMEMQHLLCFFAPPRCPTRLPLDSCNPYCPGRILIQQLIKR